MELNSSQRLVTEYNKGPLLVVADPGSGKTRIIIERITHLINSGIQPNEILCLTFTKKSFLGNSNEDYNLDLRLHGAVLYLPQTRRAPSGI